MRGTLVFVHGTGVRQAGLEKTWAKFQEQAGKNGFDGVTLDLCDWGPTHAPNLDGIDAALPVVAAPDATVPSGDSAAAWELLLDDPLFELRLAAEAAPRACTRGGARSRPAPTQAACCLIENLGRARGSGMSTALLAAAEITGDEVREAALLVAGIGGVRPGGPGRREMSWTRTSSKRSPGPSWRTCWSSTGPTSSASSPSSPSGRSCDRTSSTWSCGALFSGETRGSSGPGCGARSSASWRPWAPTSPCPAGASSWG